MKRIFIFDLDDTLGKKTPPFPAITRENTDYLRKLAAQGEILSIATARPKSLTYQGMKHGGLNKEEVGRMFPIGVYEDGLYVESNGVVVYNALDETGELFKSVWKAFYDEVAQKFFRENGFILVPGNDVEQLPGGEFRLVDYEGNPLKKLEVPNGSVPIYQQDNIVKQVYKSPRGFLGDDMKKLKPIFERMAILTEEHLSSRFPGWEKVAKIYTWDDAIDLYPKLPGKEGIFLKGHGLEIALSNFNIPSESAVYVCGDGKNDISMVEWAAQRFPKTRTVCPSNASNDLINFLIEHKHNHTLLVEDCTEFCKGLKRVIVSQ